jgi:hypothetical protein
MDNLRPTTLAAIVCDLQNYCTTETDQDLYHAAKDALEANVGEADAIVLVNEAARP